MRMPPSRASSVAWPRDARLPSSTCRARPGRRSPPRPFAGPRHGSSLRGQVLGERRAERLRPLGAGRHEQGRRVPRNGRGGERRPGRGRQVDDGGGAAGGQAIEDARDGAVLVEQGEHVVQGHRTFGSTGDGASKSGRATRKTGMQKKGKVRSTRPNASYFTTIPLPGCGSGAKIARPVGPESRGMRRRANRPTGGAVP
jgi:hypothetical protein